MLVQVALCDDEQQARQHYGQLVESIASRHGIDVSLRFYESGNQLLFDMADGHFIPDIVLLDIVMPVVSGMEVAHALQGQGYAGALIFVTQTERFVFDAFDVGAFNYLIKQAGADEARFEQIFLAAIKHAEVRQQKYVLLNGISEHRNVALDTIEYFESNRHVCTVHYGSKASFEFISTLSRIENYLLPYGFVRIHKSFLVNCDYIESYTFKQCTLRSGVELPVGRQHYPELKEAIEARAAVMVSRN